MSYRKPGGIFLLLILSLNITLFASEKIKMGILPVIDTLPLQVAKQNNYFKEQNLDVELIRFMSADDRNMAILTGQIDGFFGDIPAVFLLIKDKIPLKLLTVSYQTTPGQPMFGLALSSKSKDKKSGDLTVAISKGTIIEYLLDTMAPLQPVSNYKIVPTAIKQMPIRMQMLATNQIDSALLPEPLLKIAVSKGSKIILTDEQLDQTLTILAIHQNKLGLKAPFLKAYLKAVRELNQNGSKYKTLMVKTCRIPPPMANHFIRYKYPEPHLPSEQELEAVQNWMLTKQMIRQKIAYQNLIK